MSVRGGPITRRRQTGGKTVPEQLPKPGTFADKVQALDMALTGRTANDAAHTWRDQPGMHDPTSWAYGVYYLSDGGYSRLAWARSASRLFLTSNSADTTKANWRNCKELIHDVEAEVINAITEAGIGP